MELWIKLVEITFRKQGMARQEKLYDWLSETTAERSWRERLKERDKNNNNLNSRTGFGGSILDPGRFRQDFNTNPD